MARPMAGACCKPEKFENIFQVKRHSLKARIWNVYWLKVFMLSRHCNILLLVSMIGMLLFWPYLHNTLLAVEWKESQIERAVTRTLRNMHKTSTAFGNKEMSDIKTRGKIKLLMTKLIQNTQSVSFLHFIAFSPWPLNPVAKIMFPWKGWLPMMAFWSQVL